MFNDYTPDRVNTAGARWNPPGVGAIYTVLHCGTALAEGQHAIDVQPRAPSPAACCTRWRCPSPGWWTSRVRVLWLR